MENIKETVNIFLKDREINKRYTSFDFCYNHFYSFYKEDKLNELGEEYLEISCYKLGFYLASWGMMRGKSFLLQHSIYLYKDLIQLISKLPRGYWEIDIHNYTQGKNIELLIELKEKIQASLGKENKVTDTLATKIMLGVFGNIPAFDGYFKDGLGVGIVNQKNLHKIYSFYKENEKEFKVFDTIKTLEFMNNKSTGNIFYTKAKILDMYGFTAGFEKDKK